MKNIIFFLLLSFGLYGQSYHPKTVYSVGNTLGEALGIGSNDAFGLNLKTNNTNRLRFDSGGRMFSGTLTDVILTATDSARLEGAGGKIDITSGFTRLYAGSNIAYQTNNSNLATVYNVADNNTSAYLLQVIGGASFLQHNSTDLAEVTTLGSATTGGTVALNSATTKLQTSTTDRYTISSDGSHNVITKDNEGVAWNMGPTGESFLLANTLTGSEELVVNENGSTVSFRVESDGVANALAVEGASNTIRLNTGVRIATTNVTATGTYAITGTDYYIRINATTGTQTYTLPTALSGRVLKFKRVDNNPATVITFTGTVDGATNPTSTGGGSPIAALATQYGAVTLVGNGSGWDVL